ncbi:DNA-binding transcriptional regulator OxyR [Haemophilus paracuniculus]|uniref:DNA-binding transcriptional regulator OxyR n=1 Tax=Haemophilus paracuniculus TaxID=734 RepID=A0A1T0ATR7_9PAST|nr:DNA-binding transcriptional regulator OxyR [Haemophilus paracuniculus]OOR99762.1 DNA-binding transcriptional regulator OxyR [Haemophilus paracuniculus]
MNIRNLEYLIALAEHRHYHKAAEACNVSQPTLSGQIKKLEDELGVILCERTSRRVLFTQAGLMLVEQAKAILREVNVFKEMVSNQGKEMAGPIHIGIIPTLSPYLLPIILPTLKSQYPELELFLYEQQTAQLMNQLEAGQLDCAILALGKETEPFIEVPMFKERMLLAVSARHEWASRDKVDLKELNNCEMLLLDDGHCLRSQTLDYCMNVGAKENQHFKATSLETLRNMVAADTGITLIPELASRVGSENAIRYLPFSDPEPYRAIGLVYRPGSSLRMRYERLAKEITTLMEG